MRAVTILRISAFTLVELLVSVVVLALLLTLAVPSLQQAMALAQQSKCTSNLRSQTQAHTLYGSNNHFNKAPILWMTGNSFGYYLVSPNIKMYRKPVGQGILIKNNYMPHKTILCPSSSMLDDSLMDEEAWMKSSISGSSYSYFWRHADNYSQRSDLLSEYKYSDSQNEGRYGLSMDFNSMSGHTYSGAFDTTDWPSHPVLGIVNISYSDGSVVAEDNTKIVLKPPFNTKSKLEWWDKAHKAYENRK